jgi:hypothetical protein
LILLRLRPIDPVWPAQNPGNKQLTGKIFQNKELAEVRRLAEPVFILADFAKLLILCNLQNSAVRAHPQNLTNKGLAGKIF